MFHEVLRTETAISHSTHHHHTTDLNVSELLPEIFHQILQSGVREYPFPMRIQHSHGIQQNFRIHPLQFLLVCVINLQQLTESHCVGVIGVVKLLEGTIQSPLGWIEPYREEAGRATQ